MENIFQNSMPLPFSQRQIRTHLFNKLKKSMLEKNYYRIWALDDDLGEGPRKQRFALDLMLSESRDNLMIGYFVRGTVILILSVLKQNYDATTFGSFYHGLRVNLFEFCSLWDCLCLIEQNGLAMNIWPAYNWAYIEV